MKTGGSGETQPTDSAASRARVLALISAYTMTQAVRSFAELGLADELEPEGGATAAELAERAQVAPALLERLLIVLWRVGIVARESDRYVLTSAGGLLCRRRPGNLWSVASFFGDELYRVAATLPETVRTGRPGAEAALGRPIWQYMDENPERGAAFDDMLVTLGAPDVEAVLEAYDFSFAPTVVDVGGGAGALLHAILTKHAHVRGVLVETEGAIDRIERDDVPAAVLRRCDYMRRNFFESLPARGDVYILKHVLHDWDDEQALEILKICCAALSRNARLLIIEALLDSSGKPPSIDWMALGITAAFGGKERTLDEYRGLCARAGLVVCRCIETSATVSVIEVTLR